MRADWQTEKEALEDIMVSLRAELRQKDDTLNIMEAEKVGHGDGEFSSC